MRKELVVFLLVITMVTIIATNTVEAVDPIVSAQNRLIQDETMKPLDPPLESHPTANQYTAPVTNPANAYDDIPTTYSSTNISLQPYPSVYSKPTAYSGNASVTNPANAYDLSQTTFATLTIAKSGSQAAMREFNLTTFNTTLITTISSVDVHIKYNLTVTVGKCWYKFVLYVGTKKTDLMPFTETQLNVDTITGNWTAVPEPNDGLWTKTEVGSIKIGIETRPDTTADTGIFRVFEVSSRVYSPVIRNFQIKTFSPTNIASYSYLNLNMNCAIIVGGCSYKITMMVSSKNTTLQAWSGVSQINPGVITWESVTEPNDGWWNQTDLNNMRIIIETQITKSENSGEFRIYEILALIRPPPVSLYAAAHEGSVTVTNPTNAYDKNQLTYASISLPITYGTYFAIKSVNTTIPKEYTSVDIHMRYAATTFAGGQYKISVYVSGKSVDLLVPTVDNLTEPITRVWHGVCEPNDAVWNQTDLSNLQIRVEKATEGGTCTFQEYEAWVIIPADNLTLRVSVSGVLASAALYAWTFNLTFNKDVLQGIIVSDGPFLKQAGFTNFAGFTINNTAGWIYAGSALDDWWSGGASGSGALATITFNVVGKGNSMFSFSETQLRTFNEGIGMPVALAHTNTPGWFHYLAGDVNGDAKVNYIDLYQVGKAYGLPSGSPTWLNEDLNKDGTVNQSDLALIVADFGKT